MPRDPTEKYRDEIRKHCAQWGKAVGLYKLDRTSRGETERNLEISIYMENNFENHFRNLCAFWRLEFKDLYHSVPLKFWLHFGLTFAQRYQDEKGTPELNLDFGVLRYSHEWQKFKKGLFPSESHKDNQNILQDFLSTCLKEGSSDIDLHLRDYAAPNKRPDGQDFDIPNNVLLAATGGRNESHQQADQSVDQSVEPRHYYNLPENQADCFPDGSFPPQGGNQQYNQLRSQPVDR
ncbi:hypothetical protein ACMFMF_011829 [Clarireedia jacksonii]